MQKEETQKEEIQSNNIKKTIKLVWNHHNPNFLLCWYESVCFYMIMALFIKENKNSNCLDFAKSSNQSVGPFVSKLSTYLC